MSDQPIPDAPGPDRTAPDALRQRLVAAMVAEHYRRAKERIEATPEEHQAAFADIALTVVQPLLDLGKAALAKLQRDVAAKDAKIEELADFGLKYLRRAETAEAERDHLLDLLVVQVGLHRANPAHKKLTRRGCQTCLVYRDLAESDAFKAAEARRMAEIAEALRNGNLIACPAPEDQPGER